LEIPASSTDFQNTGLLPASTKLAIKYRPGRCNTGHLATLLIPDANAVTTWNLRKHASIAQKQVTLVQ